MSAFGIFALILTTAYIIYFAAVIFRDITASKKTPDADANTETFDVSSFAQEESVEVKETNGGFAVGDNETSTETVTAQANETEDAGEAQADSEEAIKATTDKMDDVGEEIHFEVSLPDSDFHDCLIHEQVKNKTIGTSYMFGRKEAAAAEPQKSSADDVQPKDEI